MSQTPDIVAAGMAIQDTHDYPHKQSREFSNQRAHTTIPTRKDFQNPKIPRIYIFDWAPKKVTMSTKLAVWVEVFYKNYKNKS